MKKVIIYSCIYLLVVISISLLNSQAMRRELGRRIDTFSKAIFGNRKQQKDIAYSLK